jgi:hypothetical protein
MKKDHRSTNKKERDGDEQISRKEALQKVGKYAAFTASSMMVILNPVKAQYESSPELPPEWFY